MSAEHVHFGIVWEVARGCPCCHGVTQVYEQHLYLTVPSTARSISEYLQNYGQLAFQPGACEFCLRAVELVERSKIVRAPNFLILQLGIYDMG